MPVYIWNPRRLIAPQKILTLTWSLPLTTTNTKDEVIVFLTISDASMLECPIGQDFLRCSGFSWVLNLVCTGISFSLVHQNPRLILSTVNSDIFRTVSYFV